MTNKKSFKLTIDNQLVEVILRRSTIEDSSYHSALLLDSDKILLDGTPSAFNRKNIGTFLYPHCLACVESPESVREISLDQFLKIDEREADDWARLSKELNDHWWKAQADYISGVARQFETMTAEAKKKSGTLLSGSRGSMEVPTTAEASLHSLNSDSTTTRKRHSKKQKNI